MSVLYYDIKSKRFNFKNIYRKSLREKQKLLSMLGGLREQSAKKYFDNDKFDNALYGSSLKNIEFRIDRFITHMHFGVPIGKIQEWIKRGLVLINFMKVKHPEKRVNLGDVVQLHPAIWFDLLYYKKRYRSIIFLRKVNKIKKRIVRSKGRRAFLEWLFRKVQRRELTPFIKNKAYDLFELVYNQTSLTINNTHIINHLNRYAYTYYKYSKKAQQALDKNPNSIYVNAYKKVFESDYSKLILAYGKDNFEKELAASMPGRYKFDHYGYSLKILPRTALKSSSRYKTYMKYLLMFNQFLVKRRFLEIDYRIFGGIAFRNPRLGELVKGFKRYYTNKRLKIYRKNILLRFRGEKLDYKLLFLWYSRYF
jgi:Ribosomal protein S4 and related proteins